MKFLTIDNQALIQFGLKTLIEKQFTGAEIRQVPDKDLAYDALKAGHFDLVFVGIHDDEQDGFAWVSKIKALRPHSKILIYLSFEEKETEQIYRQAGADEVVTYRVGLDGMSDCFKTLLAPPHLSPRHK